MVAITFTKVEDNVDLTAARYKVRSSFISTSFLSSSVSIVDYSMLPCAFYPCRVSSRLILRGMITKLHRLFEIFMAFDALRLRNVIQLVGILRAYPQSILAVLCARLDVPLGLFQFSMLRLSSWPRCKSTKRIRLWSQNLVRIGRKTTSYVSSICSMECARLSFAATERWWPRNALADCSSFPNRGSCRHCGSVAPDDLVRPSAVLRVWVSASHHCLALSGVDSCSWAIFHIVGANPAAKSECTVLSHMLHWLTECCLRSNVPVLPGHYLSTEVRLLRVHRCHDAGLFPDVSFISSSLTLRI